jgi:FHA domain-containing protein
MAECPKGHESADPEFCDVCGLAMDGPAPAAAEPVEEAPAPVAPDLPPEGATCRSCGAALAGRFCEECGHDSLATLPEPATPAPAPATPDGLPPAAWTATVVADRDYYQSVMEIDGPDAAAVKFPPFCPDRTFPLRGKQITIGRHSANRGITPDIDLTGPPEDPGVSHLHAVLLAQPEGFYAVVDLDSSNGTTVNDDPDPIPANTPRALADGDRVYVGAWTRITLNRTRT